MKFVCVNVCACSAVLLYYLSRWSVLNVSELTLLDSFIFATVMSNIDPLSSLVILTSIHADERVSTVLVGEAMFNSAVTVLMFHTLTGMDETVNVNAMYILEMIGLFIGNGIGTIAIGITIGFVSSNI